MTQGKQRNHTFLVIREVGRPDRIVVWDTQEITLGRSSENDITADHPDISRHHATFAREDGNYVVKNMSTSNATFVNGQEVKAAKLAPKDLIKVGELQLQFIQTTKNPASVGLKMDYASQLKGFGIPGGGNAEATMLGLVDPLPSTDDDDDGEVFQVAPANDFEYDLHDMEGKAAAVKPAPAPRDLDVELDFGLDDPPAPPPPKPEPKAADGVLKLKVEVAGLSPELRAAVDALLDRVIELPSMKLRLRAD